MRSPEEAEKRDAVGRLAPTDTAQALALARQIADPWYRCQALANVARYAPSESVSIFANESLEAAFRQEDAYKVVCVAAWPIRALIERNETPLLPLLLEDLVRRSRDIGNPVSRLEALFTLWSGAFYFQHSLTDAVFEEFVGACDSANSWRAGARLEEALLILSARDRVRASELAQSMPEGTYKRRTLAKLKLAELAHLEPRPFFWVTVA